MNGKIKRPLSRCIFVGCVLFVIILCIVLGLLNFSGFRQSLYKHYENYIRYILRYTASKIDVDDLDECIRTGKESEKYLTLQKELDQLKDRVQMDYLYVVIPLNSQETDNMQNVIAAFSREEYRNGDDQLFWLNQLTGDAYSSHSAKKYLSAYEKGEMTFFEDITEWGDEYTGMWPLFDSKGNKVAALCMDVNVDEIHTQLYRHFLYTVSATVLIGALFTAVYLIWTRRNITKPIQELEKSVSEFAAESHLQQSPEKLMLNVPEIHSGNEVESLSNAVKKMSKDIRDYATYLKRAEEESKKQSMALGEALSAAESANRAKTAFLSNMSHEIRTPMNAIIGLDNIALNGEGLPEETRTYLEKIGTSAEHLLNIINDILDMSRIESGRMAIKSEEFSFIKAIEQVNTIISGQCRDKGLSYDCRVLGEVDEFYIGDDMKLRQVMINILGNAVKFTPEGGAVSFTVERIARFDNNATLRFVMEDNGIGMSKEFLPKIFDSFSQEATATDNQYGSTGLGMAITKNLVVLMNGDISVESEQGVGTTFTVTVTLKESPRNAGEDDDFDIPLTEMSVLVIDDDLSVGEHTRQVMAQTGIVCDVAPPGEETLKLIELRNARREPYHLILLDCRMPQMDELDTARRIRDIVGNDSVIMILTAYSWENIADRAQQVGVDGFIPKPLFGAAAISEYKIAYKKRRKAVQRPKADLKGKRVLVAEDVEINAEILQMLLKSKEMATEIAENGRIAVEMVASHPEGWYDAILMDMRMPEMNGLEATAAIRGMDRADSKTIPIIALTANAFDEDVQRSLQAGLNAHLSKPVEPDSLYETLQSLIK